MKNVNLWTLGTFDEVPPFRKNNIFWDDFHYLAKRIFYFLKGKNNKNKKYIYFYLTMQFDQPKIKSVFTYVWSCQQEKRRHI